MLLNFIEIANEDFENEIQDLNADELSLVSGGVLHFHILPQVHNVPE